MEFCWFAASVSFLCWSSIALFSFVCSFWSLVDTIGKDEEEEEEDEESVWWDGGKFSIFTGLCSSTSLNLIALLSAVTTMVPVGFCGVPGNGGGVETSR